LLPRLLAERGHELRRGAGRQVRVETPVLLRLESPDLPLALADQPHRHRLHPAGRQPTAHPLPEQRAQLVADQPVEHAARLLGVHLLLVDAPRVQERRLDRPLGDLVEHHPVDAVGRELELLGHVPADRLPLAVGVGRDVEAAGLLGRPLELLERLGLRAHGHVLGGEVALDVDAQLARRQILEVPERGLHDVPPVEVLLDGLHLGGRLDDDQRAPSCHASSPQLRTYRWPASRRTSPRTSSAVSPAATRPDGRPLPAITASISTGSSPSWARIARSPGSGGAGAGAASAGTWRRAARHWGGHSATTSSQVWTSRAPSRISAFVPWLETDEALPGTA